MLRLIRALGFLAPVPVVLLGMAGLTAAVVADTDQRFVFSAISILAGAARASRGPVACWMYAGSRCAARRLRPRPAALERTPPSEQPTRWKVAGTPAERRLARAFNAASGAL